MSTPDNTSKYNPRDLLIEAAVMGSSGMIERQESQRQAQLVRGEVLPVRDLDRETWEILERFGVKRLESVPGDPLFVKVELPEGWSKIASDHSMWSYLVDQKGRQRAMIFYKAAFYDRDAHIGVMRRFQVQRDYDREDYERVVVYRVLDCGEVIYTTEPVSLPEQPPGEAHDTTYYDRKQSVMDVSLNVAEKWVEERYPDWRNTAAYWD